MPTPTHPRDLMPSKPSRSLQATSGQSPPREGLIEYDHPASFQIGQWLRQNVLIKDEEYGKCIRLTVKHFSITKKPQGDVTKVNIPTTFGEDGIEHLVSEIIQAAQDDANNLHSGIQLYAVFAHFEKNAYYTPRRYFRVGAEEEYDPESGGADPSETPDARGLVAQTMRHLEAVFKTSVSIL